jgi:hypothetical protein
MSAWIVEMGYEITGPHSLKSNLTLLNQFIERLLRDPMIEIVFKPDFELSAVIDTCSCLVREETG